MTTGMNQLIEAVPFIDEDTKSTVLVSGKPLPSDAYFEIGEKVQMEISIDNGSTWKRFIIRDRQHANGKWQYKLNYNSGQQYGSAWYAERLLKDA